MDAGKVDLEFTGEIRRLPALNAGDSLIVRIGARLTNVQAAGIQRYVSQRFPGHQVLVLDAAADLGVLPANQGVTA